MFKKNLSTSFICALIIILSSCKSGDSADTPATAQETSACLSDLTQNTEWSGSTEVQIDGYTGNAMEPKASSDQVVLFFNDKPSDDSQMDIHYAIKQVSGRYQYIGTVPGTVSNTSLDGVPAVDQNGIFYFTSLRNYTTTFQTLFSGQIAVTGPSALQVNSVASADNSISAHANGTLDMDMDISWNGLWAVISRAQFSGQNYPDSSRLILSQVSARQLSSYAQSETVLAAINSLTTKNCRLYAPSLSDDLKEIYFTILEPKANSTSSFNFAIAVAKRANSTAAFSAPQKIAAISGEATEGPAITFDDGGKTLFYHKFDSTSSRFKIYKVTRP